MPIHETNEDTDDIERLEPPTGEPANTKIDLSEPDERDDDDEDDKPVAAKGAQAPKMERDKITGKWTQKRQEKDRKFKESKAVADANAAWERRLQEVQATQDRRIAEVEARFARQQPVTGQPADPHEAKLRDIDRQIASELKLIEADEKHGYENYMKLQEARSEAIFDKKLAIFQKGQEATRQQQRPDPYAGRVPIIESEYPWTNDPRYKELAIRAQSYKQYLVGALRRPDTLDTDREALSHAVAEWGQEYGLRQPARPTMAQRTSYVRPGNGAAAGRDNGPRYVELPGAMQIERTGLSSEQLRRALRDVEDS